MVSAKRERGFALLIVLWSLVLIAFLTTQILASGRNALLRAAGLREAAVARASADGAINEALFHVLAYGPAHWPADASLHLLDDGASVRIDSLGGKINPNLASTGLLAGLFQAVGAAPEPARDLASAIVAWRSLAPSKAAAQARLAAYQRAGLPYGPPGHNFADAADLASVIGMKPALLAAVLPHLSLYQPNDPDLRLADSVVARALTLAGQVRSSRNASADAIPVVQIEAEARAPGGLTIQRTAIISTPGANAPSPFQFLSLIDH